MRLFWPIAVSEHQHAFMHECLDGHAARMGGKGKHRIHVRSGYSSHALGGKRFGLAHLRLKPFESLQGCAIVARPLSPPFLRSLPQWRPVCPPQQVLNPTTTNFLINTAMLLLLPLLHLWCLCNVLVKKRTSCLPACTRPESISLTRFPDWVMCHIGSALMAGCSQELGSAE